MKFLAALSFCFALAQAQPAAMPLSVAACGAINAGNGTGLVLHGTLGQSGVRVSVAGNNELHTGFWGAREYARPHVDAEEETRLPGEFSFDAAYPNPFNPVTTLSFSLAHASHVQLDLYDATGRHVASIADRVFQSGEHAIDWDAGENASGAYFARLESAGFSQTQKLYLIK